MRSAASKPPTAGAMARRNPSIASLVPIAAALLGVTLLAAGSPARAQDYGNDSWRPRPISNFETWADGRLVDVQLKVDGDPAPLYVAPGHDDRHYFQAFAGRNYSVLLKNNSGRRVAVLLAVDGLNAVNGEITALRPDEGMYVLGPWEQATIRGWRTALHATRRAAPRGARGRAGGGGADGVAGAAPRARRGARVCFGGAAPATPRGAGA